VGGWISRPIAATFPDRELFVDLAILRGKAMQDPITDVREISRIAYGFKASKALLVAIDLELFSRFSGGAKSLADLADELDIAEKRLDTLLTALTRIGLLVWDGDAYTNAPASED